MRALSKLVGGEERQRSADSNAKMVTGGGKVSVEAASLRRENIGIFGRTCRPHGLTECGWTLKYRKIQGTWKSLNATHSLRAVSQGTTITPKG